MFFQTSGLPLLSTSFPRQPLACLALLVMLLGACSSSESSSESAGSSASSLPKAPTTTEAPVDLVVLVTNDDGVEAVGLDALVAALSELDDTIVHVVVPRENQSGVGDLVTDGSVTTAPSQTINGFAATVIDGTPGDAVAWSLRELDPAPDLVLAGPNEGQNIGVFAEQSAVVGAAKVGARSGLPGLAVGLGIPAPYDFEQGTQIALDWVDDNRTAILNGSAPADVTLINVPNCADGGDFKGLIEVPVAETFGQRDPFATDCTATPDAVIDDVDAFLAGYASISRIPAN